MSLISEPPLDSPVLVALVALDLLQPLPQRPHTLLDLTQHLRVALKEKVLLVMVSGVVGVGGRMPLVWQIRVNVLREL